MKIRLFFPVLFLLFSCQEKSFPSKLESYSFSGDEPFWELNINRENLVLSLFSINEELSENVKFSDYSERGVTAGFQGKHIYGIINKPWGTICNLAVTEKDSLEYEVFFVFEGKAYRGCGERILP